ncbi:MAG TPA: SWIM zinc finger domain-containing protein [Casimicrobium sp.]|nr:SWIM zinc finger domain-containing protein [Casimicrobium sp.]
MALSVDEVLALSPDASSAKAARGLTGTSQWPTLGISEVAAWGECQGSGAKPYQTQVDLNGPVFRCSCPSRKFPCKHGLALLLLRAQAPSAFTTNTPPLWVSEWLESRAERAQKKQEQQAEKTATAVDPDASAKREAQRWKRIQSASVELQRWLADQVTRGLGSVTQESLENWKTMAARMVDAQAPGLGQRILAAAESVRTSPERALHHLGLLHLACEALQRLDLLDPALQAELRTVVGWPFDKTEVLAVGEHVEDHWTVLGVIAEAVDAKLVERRVWLFGQQTGRRALLLEHAFGGRGFEQTWRTGTCVAARLAFFPGSRKLRALPVEITLLETVSLALPLSLEHEWSVLSERAAESPWAPLHPMLLRDSIVLRVGDDAPNVRVVCDNEALPISIDDASFWQMLAVTGGRKHHIAGEWDGECFRPLSIWADESVRTIWQWGQP